MEEELFWFPSEIATHRLILLHGWGADAEDLIPLGKSLITGIEQNIELISLRAPENHPQGIGKQWYELFPADWDESVKAVFALDDRIKKLSSEKMPLEKTVLMGFSQGGAMALSTGAHMPLAGLVGCSSYPHPDFAPPRNSPPVFLTHGSLDTVVPINASKKLLQLFKEKSEAYSFLRIFKGGHEINHEIYTDIQLFLRKCFQ